MINTNPIIPCEKLPLILHSQTPYTTSPILVKQTDWCYILGSPKSTNLVTYETYTNHNHLLSPVLFPSGRENFMRTTFSILTCPDCEHSSEEHIPRDYWVILHRCRSCNKMLKPHAGNCCVFCSYGSVKCNGEQNSAIGALKVIWSGFNSLKPTQWSTPQVANNSTWLDAWAYQLLYRLAKGWICHTRKSHPVYLPNEYFRSACLTGKKFSGQSRRGNLFSIIILFVVIGSAIITGKLLFKGTYA